MKSRCVFGAPRLEGDGSARMAYFGARLGGIMAPGRTVGGDTGESRDRIDTLSLPSGGQRGSPGVPSTGVRGAFKEHRHLNRPVLQSREDRRWEGMNPALTCHQDSGGRAGQGPASGAQGMGGGEPS